MDLVLPLWCIHLPPDTSSTNQIIKEIILFFILHTRIMICFTIWLLYNNDMICFTIWLVLLVSSTKSQQLIFVNTEETGNIDMKLEGNKSKTYWNSLISVRFCLGIVVQIVPKLTNDKSYSNGIIWSWKKEQFWQPQVQLVEWYVFHSAFSWLGCCICVDFQVTWPLHSSLEWFFH